MNTHPYQEFTIFKTWSVLAQALNDLENNRDIILNTQKEYIIGYLMKTLNQQDLLKK